VFPVLDEKIMKIKRSESLDRGECQERVFNLFREIGGLGANQKV
jgi:hypothetical protein